MCLAYGGSEWKSVRMDFGLRRRLTAGLGEAVGKTLVQAAAPSRDLKSVESLRLLDQKALATRSTSYRKSTSPHLYFTSSMKHLKSCIAQKMDRHHIVNCNCRGLCRFPFGG